MKRITFEGLFCDICQCVGEPGNTSECESGFCDQRRTWERLKEYEDKIDRGELAEVVWCKDCVSQGNCLTEDTFRIARIDNPYCCGGKRKTNCGAKIDGDCNG